MKKLFLALVLSLVLSTSVLAKGSSHIEEESSETHQARVCLIEINGDFYNGNQFTKTETKSGELYIYFGNRYVFLRFPGQADSKDIYIYKQGLVKLLKNHCGAK